METMPLRHFQSRVAPPIVMSAIGAIGFGQRKFLGPEVMSEANAVGSEANTILVSRVPSSGRARRGTALWQALLGAGLIILAVGVGGYELADLSMSGRYSAVTLGQIWFALDVGSLNLVQAVIQRFLHPGLWDPVIVWALRWPLWSLLGGSGVAVVTIYLSRR